jgi:hypothetical protein
MCAKGRERERKRKKKKLSERKEIERATMRLMNLLLRPLDLLLLHL